MEKLLSFENPVFAKFAFYAVVVLVKTMMMSLLTTRQRMSSRVFINPEDARSFGGEKLKTITDDSVERLRRCHLNDLENVIPFVLVGSLYVLTSPDHWWAAFFFRTFTASRILHTICYLIALPQPSRGLSFLVGWLTTLSMAVAVLLKMYQKEVNNHQKTVPMVNGYMGLYILVANASFVLYDNNGKSKRSRSILRNTMKNSDKERNYPKRIGPGTEMATN